MEQSIDGQLQCHISAPNRVAKYQFKSFFLLSCFNFFTWRISFKLKHYCTAKTLNFLARISITVSTTHHPTDSTLTSRTKDQVFQCPPGQKPIKQLRIFWPDTITLHFCSGTTLWRKIIPFDLLCKFINNKMARFEICYINLVLK